ncbi:MAG: hypothetical protein AAGC90_02860 [Curtobacterium sp.]
MAAFTHGDQPVASFEYTAPEAADRIGAKTALSVEGQTIATDTTGDSLYGTWDALTLPDPGFYPIYALTTVGERVERSLVDWLVVVDPADQWHNVATARLEWDGAPEQDGTLYRLLNTAREQVEAYAPALTGTEVPERYRAGQMSQARNMFNAAVTAGEVQVDLNGNAIRPRPLDWAVKQLLRPARAKKALG